MRITFWGTRGTLPSPLDANEFRAKAKRLLMNAQNVNLKNDAQLMHILMNFLFRMLQPLEVIHRAWKSLKVIIN